MILQIRSLLLRLSRRKMMSDSKKTGNWGHVIDILRYMCHLGNLYSWSTSNVANPVLNHPQFHISPGLGDRSPPKLDTTLSNIIEFPRKDATCIHIKNCIFKGYLVAMGSSGDAQLIITGRWECLKELPQTLRFSVFQDTRPWGFAHLRHHHLRMWVKIEYLGDHRC